MAKRVLTTEVWADNAAGLLSLIAQDETVPLAWRQAAFNALCDAPEATLLGALAAVLSLAE